MGYYLKRKNHLLLVDYDSNYDCDFNQMLDMQIVINEPMTILNFDMLKLLNHNILFDSHCFGCTGSYWRSYGFILACSLNFSNLFNGNITTF